MESDAMEERKGVIKSVSERVGETGTESHSVEKERLNVYFMQYTYTENVNESKLDEKIESHSINSANSEFNKIKFLGLNRAVY